MSQDPPVLQALGYWSSDREPHLPDPQRLVRPGWLAGRPLEALVGYLRAGALVVRARGRSRCRLCGERDNGSAELTDGVWVWPEGLAHYVEAHEVTLPWDFVQHARVQGWRVPEVRVASLAAAIRNPQPWLDWAQGT